MEFQSWTIIAFHILTMGFQTRTSVIVEWSWILKQLCSYYPACELLQPAPNNNKRGYVKFSLHIGELHEQFTHNKHSTCQGNSKGSSVDSGGMLCRSCLYSSDTLNNADTANSGQSQSFSSLGGTGGVSSVEGLLIFCITLLSEMLLQKILMKSYNFKHLFTFIFGNFVHAYSVIEQTHPS